VELIDAAGMRQVRMTSLRQRRVAWRPDQAALTDGSPASNRPGGPPKRPTKAEAGHYGLRATGYGLRATGYGLRATGYGLRATGYGLRATGYGLRDGHYDSRRHRTIEHRDGPLRVGQAIA